MKNITTLINILNKHSHFHIISGALACVMVFAAAASPCTLYKVKNLIPTCNGYFEAIGEALGCSGIIKLCT
jgi:hypothetical protein